jgi:hypothetical protein
MVGRGSARAVARDGPESQDRAPSSHGSDGASPDRPERAPTAGLHPGN